VDRSALLSRDAVAAPARGRAGSGAAPPVDMRSLASAVGNRAFTRQVARCGACPPAQARWPAAVPKQGNHDSPARPWVDDVLESAADALYGAVDWVSDTWSYYTGATCPTGNSAKKTKVKIQPVVICDDDGKNPTATPSLVAVKRIWKKCCVDVEVVSAKAIDKTSYKTLAESPDDNPTAEERKMFADGGSFDGVQVYVPEQFTMGGKTGKDVNGGGATYDAGKAHPKIVVVEGTAPEVVAHELGHAMGHMTHDRHDTVMKPTGKHDVANNPAVSKGVCASARTGAVLVNGAEDCCMNPK
jgi:hypothetical protein